MLVMIVMMRSCRVGLLGQPALHVWNLLLWIVEPAVEEPRCGGFACGGIEQRGGWIERSKPGDQRLPGPAMLSGVGEVALGQDDAIGDRDLLEGLDIVIESCGAIDGVDYCDDAV